VSKFELSETQFERTVKEKIATWSEKMTVLSTFFEFTLKLLLNNLKKKDFGTVK